MISKKYGQAISYIVIIGLLVYNVLLVNRIGKVSKKLNEANTKFEILSANHNDNIFSGVVKNIDLAKVIYDENGLPIEIKNVLVGADKIIFRYKETACESCIESEMKNLNLLAKEVGAGNILIFASYASLKSLKAAKERYEMPFNIFNVRSEEILMAPKLDQINVPYTFVLKKDGTIAYMSINDKNLISVSAKYYENLAQIYRPFKEKLSGQVIFQATDIDLGIIKKGEKPKAFFLLKNDMDKALIISSVDSNCGCTVINWDKKPVLPGQNTKIEIQYDSSDLGPFLKNIVVHSNAPEQYKRISIRGTTI